MPRQLRKFEVGDIFHIVSRGVEKRNIFMKPQDYSRFILGLEFFNRQNINNNLWELIAKAGTVPALERILNEREKKSKPLIELMAFALMPNHYHLVAREIIKDGISLFMRKMGGYSTYFNKQYKRVGPLFQSRYKAVPVINDIQLSNVFVYVHTNPIELIEPQWKDFKVRNSKKAIRWLASYKQSSYLDYMEGHNYSNVIQKKFFLEFYGGKNNCQKTVEDWIKFKAQNTKLGPEIIE